MGDRVVIEEMVLPRGDKDASSSRGGGGQKIRIVRAKLRSGPQGLGDSAQEPNGLSNLHGPAVINDERGPVSSLPAFCWP